MSRVRIEFYCDLSTFYKLDGLRQQRSDKGFTSVVNAICIKHFANISGQDQAVESLNKVIQRYVEEIDGLKKEISKLKEELKTKEGIIYGYGKRI